MDMYEEEESSEGGGVPGWVVTFFKDRLDCI